MEFQQISISHPAVKDVLAIQNNTAPNRFGLFVAEGLWAARVALDTGLRIDTFYWCHELAHSDEAKKRARELSDRARRTFQVSETTMARMAERGNPDGIVATVEMPLWHPDEIELGDSALILVTDGIEIPGNLGTLIRTLDACKADLLILTNRRTRMSHPKVLRASQGMSVRVPHIEFEDTDEAIAWLKKRHVTVYLADTNESVNYRRLDYTLHEANGPGRGQRTVRHHKTLVSARLRACRRPHVGLRGQSQRVGLGVRSAVRGSRTQRALAVRPAEFPSSRSDLTQAGAVTSVQ